MRLEIVPRGDVSTLARLMSPVGALAVAILIGGVLVALLGKSPMEALHVYFIDPLSQSWTWQELAIKAQDVLTWNLV